jgi:cellulose synthase/poly-beta-1,6-N-acetylglucosamine synthase-like glycosyltransferase
MLEFQWSTFSTPQKVMLVSYFSLWGVFALLGLRRSWIVWLYRKTRHRSFDRGVLPSLPYVTVQLPIYNEVFVVERLIRAVAALDYPRSLLEIQVLDDSTDETVEIAAREVARLRENGVRIEHVRRPNRVGYKAGALAYGMNRAHGDLILIFDADFVPRPQLVREILPYFADPNVGMVQVRWDHLNPEASLLARLQSISLDGHFVIEHDARAKNGLFFNFNGTAGMWRKECIVAAGGWEHDTLTEDLDLSYRAQLAGWKFVYLRDVTCPAELPADMAAFKGQQFRWVKGSVQVAKKILPRIWGSDLPLLKKVEASVHLTHNVTYLLVLVLSLCVYPAILVRSDSWISKSTLIELVLFLFATGSVFVFYAAAQAEVRRTWKPQAKYFPALMSVAIGLSVNNTRAILEGLFGKTTPFHRTPKLGITGHERPAGRPFYRAISSGTSALEILLGLYFCAMLGFAIRHGAFGALPFVLLFLFGFLYVGASSLGLRSSLSRRS